MASPYAVGQSHKNGPLSYGRNAGTILEATMAANARMARAQASAARQPLKDERPPHGAQQEVKVAFPSHVCGLAVRGILGKGAYATVYEVLTKNGPRALRVSEDLEAYRTLG